MYAFIWKFAIHLFLLRAVDKTRFLTLLLDSYFFECINIKNFIYFVCILLHYL